MEARAIDREADAVSDAELTELALAGDPDAPIARDAVPLHLPGLSGVELLPSWYMPPAVVTLGRRRWRLVVIALVLAFLFIEAAGLCSTYGQLVIP